MGLRTLTLLAGVLGGLVWTTRMVLELAEVGGRLPDDLYWAGLALLAVAGAGAGASLVSSSMLWLRVLVAVAFPLLVWSVLEALHPLGEAAVWDGVFGVGVLAVAAVIALRDRDRTSGREPGRRAVERRHGSHAR